MREKKIEKGERNREREKKKERGIKEQKKRNREKERRQKRINTTNYRLASLIQKKVLVLSP